MIRTFENKRSLIVGMACIGISLSMPLGGQEAKAGQVTLCDAVTHPEKFDNQLITVRGRYRSDGMEDEGLSDESCGGTAIGLLIAKGAKGMDALSEALGHGFRGTADKVVLGTFTGVFHYGPSEHGHPTSFISVERIEDISSKPKHGPAAFDPLSPRGKTSPEGTLLAGSPPFMFHRTKVPQPCAVSSRKGGIALRFALALV